LSGDYNDTVVAIGEIAGKIDVIVGIIENDDPVLYDLVRLRQFIECLFNLRTSVFNPERADPLDKA
jgi:hypothetical protein